MNDTNSVNKRQKKIQEAEEKREGVEKSEERWTWRYDAEEKS